jgi:hypothetical protein
MHPFDVNMVDSSFVNAILIKLGETGGHGILGLVTPHMRVVIGDLQNSAFAESFDPAETDTNRVIEAVIAGPYMNDTLPEALYHTYEELRMEKYANGIKAEISRHRSEYAQILSPDGYRFNPVVSNLLRSEAVLDTFVANYRSSGINIALQNLATSVDNRINVLDEEDREAQFAIRQQMLNFLYNHCVTMQTNFYEGLRLEADELKHAKSVAYEVVKRRTLFK